MQKASAKYVQPRRYDHYCGLAFALDAVGERWALLVVRELLAGPRRFGDLMAGLKGVASNTLTTRLEELEHHGLITARQLRAPASTSVYELTERGRGLEPAVLELVRWAAPQLKEVDRKGLAPLRSSWLALALKAFFSPKRAKNAQGHVVFDLPTGALSVEVKDERAILRDASAMDAPDARLSCREDLVMALVTKAAPLAEVLKAPGVKLEGDAKVLARVISAFERG